jgi:carboxynorspermidine decarboxylase
MHTKAHTYCVAYKEDEIDEIISLSSHMTFNSVRQMNQFNARATAKGVSTGLRVNPEYSDVSTDLYNPASPHSRLGVTADELDSWPDGVDGMHFHVLCESNSFALEKVLEHLEAKFGQYFLKIKWLNMGGGHLMTREGYDTDHLIQLLSKFRKKHNIDIILEPGSAFAWQTGDLHTTVLDIVERHEVKTAIIDASFTCHMPDCLEMPYRPKLVEGSTDVHYFANKYRLGGVSCLAGDFLEEYSFDQPLVVGSAVTFKDMIHYTMVKTSTFNGIQHPAIGILKMDGSFELIKTFGYEDYRNRLS